VHEAEFALAFARRLGASGEVTELAPRLEIDAATGARVVERIRRELGTSGPLFGVHPGNRRSAYNWPPARYAQLVSHLSHLGRVMVTGSPEEQPILEIVRRGLNGPAARRVGFYSDLGLQELAAALAEQAVLVVSSTGPMHVAAAVGTPTVALFSPHPAHVPAKWAPLGTNHTVLVAPLADGENPRVPSQRAEELMSRVRVDEVLRAAVRYAGVARVPAA
jgi:ADP-heptose:LPS heptosyltransferase